MAQSIGTFERATEHGVPKSAGTPADALLLGYTFDDYDLRTAFTWKFLRSADRRQVAAVINGVLESDTKLVTGTILRRLLIRPRAQRSSGREFLVFIRELAA
ncbi:hypothetical protein [Mycobacteroides abscessus]|uniref:hypothetical protein n=1 Tax=Mycobacteroides abscessus TaxID=36809 RepID=UPI0013FCFC6E|nr:hypothetical protein [Mycobacteroides abscessus]